MFKYLQCVCVCVCVCVTDKRKQTLFHCLYDDARQIEIRGGQALSRLKRGRELRAKIDVGQDLDPRAVHTGECEFRSSYNHSEIGQPFRNNQRKHLQAGRHQNGNVRSGSLIKNIELDTAVHQFD